MRFEVTNDPAEDDRQRLGAGLRTHALEQLGRDGFEPVAVLMRDDDGTLVGGAVGLVNWHWLQVSLLWVDDSLRGRGYGVRLMQLIEDAGRDRGCRAAHLSTFSFQAPGFYESLGYEVFSTLEDYAPGHAKLFMRKRL